MTTDESREAFILGAGFSKAIAEAMPVLSELSAEVAVEAGDARLLHLFGDDLEAWLSYLATDHPWLRPEEVLRNQARLHEVSRMIGRVLLRRQREALSQPMPLWLKRLIQEWHQRKAVVVSLNYDTLVEKAYMAAIPPEPLSWPDHHEIYAVPVPSIVSRLRHWGVVPRQEGTFRLFKLHGSINWCYSGATTYYGETIYDLDLKSGWTAEDAEDETDVEIKAPDKTLLIVPPTAVKSMFFENETMRAQWSLAYRSLSEADVLYCLGYSLPETDQLMHYMLATSGERKTVIPVNRDPEVSERYKTHLASNNIRDEFVGESDAIRRFVDRWANDTP